MSIIETVSTEGLFEKESNKTYKSLSNYNISTIQWI